MRDEPRYSVNQMDETYDAGYEEGFTLAYAIAKHYRNELKAFMPDADTSFLDAVLIAQENSLVQLLDSGYNIEVEMDLEERYEVKKIFNAFKANRQSREDVE